MGPARRWLACLGVLASSVAIAPAAMANGRFPRAQYLRELPTDSNRLILSATYGLLSTSDRGKNWYLACERSLFGTLPEPTDEVDPLLELTPSGAILSGSDHALRVSRDGACTFATEMSLPIDPSFPATGKPNDQGAVEDITLERAKGDKAAVALVSRANPDGGTAVFMLYETLDDGVTWQLLGKPIPANMARSVLTVDVAASDANRIYVTGEPRSAVDPGVLIVSEDGGQTWTARSIPGTEDSYGTYIAALSSTDPDSIYVRTDQWLPDDTTQGQLGEDLLHFSNDGGKSWTELLRKQGKLLGFALSPDGSTVLAGYGDPVMPDARNVDKAVLGIYRAPAGTASFERIFQASVTCLTWNPTGVYACASQPDSGFHLGFARDANFDASKPNPFEPLLKLPDVRGPLPWPASNNRDVCLIDWLETLDRAGTCSALGACGDGGVPMSGTPICGVPDGGVGGSGGAGGAPHPDGGGTAGTAGAGGSTIIGEPSDDCGCRMYAASHHPWRGWALLLAGAALVRRRPRIRRSLAAASGPLPLTD
jgi:photosystem II stability/assembly factor-like uncharacterized protein